jgi:hypothetical protein
VRNGIKNRGNAKALSLRVILDAPRPGTGPGRRREGSHFQAEGERGGRVGGRAIASKSLG